MLKAAKISLEKMKRNIFMFALINCAIYIALMLGFKYLNLLHVWGLRMVNYVVLSVMCIWQIRHWIRQGGGYVPFLQAFCTALFTGSLSFIFFGGFILFYSLADPWLAPMYITDPGGTQSLLIPPIVLVLEGTGASVIVALLAMLYASRFEEDGEAMP